MTFALQKNLSQDGTYQARCLPAAVSGFGAARRCGCAAMALKYKLFYFDAKATAEPIRYLLAYGGVAYEDVRIPFAEWPKHKSEAPYGLLPFMEINGKIINQSTSIFRYFAKHLGLSGNNEFETLEMDATIETIADLRDTVGDFWWRSAETEKAKRREVLTNKILPLYLSRLEKQVQDNLGFFVNGKLSYADIYFAGSVEYFSAAVQTNVLEGYPSLKELVAKVESIPNTGFWINTRPKTYF